MTANKFMTIGAISGALAVMIGAFGAHGLEGKLSADMLKIFHTGVEYQFYHTFALLVVALLADHVDSKKLTASGWCFLSGIILFSGSLYALAMSGLTKLGAITPVGGMFFIAGWFLLAIASLKIKR